MTGGSLEGGVTHPYDNGTLAKGSPEVQEIYSIGRIRRCMKLGSLLSYNGRYGYCTNQMITFLGSTPQ